MWIRLRLQRSELWDRMARGLLFFSSSALCLFWDPTLTRLSVKHGSFNIVPAQDSDPLPYLPEFPLLPPAGYSLLEVAAFPSAD